MLVTPRVGCAQHRVWEMVQGLCETCGVGWFDEHGLHIIDMNSDGPAVREA